MVSGASAASGSGGRWLRNAGRWRSPLPLVALATLAGASGADALQGFRAGPGFEVFPYAGLSHNEREARLPASPMGGVRLSGHIWSPPGSLLRVATFLGAAGTMIAVNNEIPCLPDPCRGRTDLLLDYVLTLEGGLMTDLPGEPYVIGFVGRGYPAGEPEASRARTYGAGLGITPLVGRTALRIEVRYRRDERFPEHVDESVEVLLGLLVPYLAR